MTRSFAVGFLLSLSFVVAAVVPQPARAADSSSSGQSASVKRDRPRICLVLSGGGARGAAHVGVIKVLEEYRVPIHCIAGTSMGALVGAAYATGMTVEEMEKINGTISTELLFRERPPRQERLMREKADDYKVYVGPEIGIGGGSITIAKGVVTGVQLETVLRQLARVKGYQRFDELPIPFRAVATDLVSGKAVVFSEGELANVMRASMSVPGAVAPAEFGGMMLVDGMLTSNLPVEVARAMGADIIIAVNVGTPLLKREELNGILGVTGQMLSILTEQNVQASLNALKPTDILISPELGDFSTGDFDHLTKITPIGEAAARRVAQRLASLSMPAEEYALLRKRQQVAVAPDTRPVDEIRLSGLKAVNPTTVRSNLLTRPGEPIDQRTLDSDIRRVFGMGSFEHVSYSLLEEEGGRRILTVNAVEKTWGQDTLRLGIGLSSDFEGDAYFNIIGSYRRKWINAYGAEWRTDVQIGHTNSIGSEFFQPLHPNGRFFIAPHVSLERRVTDIYDTDQRIASYDVSSSQAGIDLGGFIGRYGEARIGVLAGKLRPTLDTGPANLSPGRSHVSQGAYTLKLALDQLDSVHFPRYGWRTAAQVFGSTDSLGADDEYTKWVLDGNGVYSFGDHTVNVAVRFGGKAGAQPLPRYSLFQWGGFMQQSGYSTGQLIGERLSYGRVMYYNRVLRGSILEGAYGGVALELGKVGDPLVPSNPDGLLKSASVFIAADSPVGPVYVGYGRAQTGNSSFYFYLGRPF